MSDSTEKSIGFVSRILTNAEKRYSQVYKELCIICGVKSFLYDIRYKWQQPNCCSKWPEAFVGHPISLVSDNGSNLIQGTFYIIMIKKAY